MINELSTTAATLLQNSHVAGAQRRQVDGFGINMYHHLTFTCPRVLLMSARLPNIDVSDTSRTYFNIHTRERHSSRHWQLVIGQVCKHKKLCNSWKTASKIIWNKVRSFLHSEYMSSISWVTSTLQNTLITKIKVHRRTSPILSALQLSCA